MSSQEKCWLGNFSLNCLSATWGTRKWGWLIRAASTSAMPPEPARISHGAACCSTALDILWGWGQGGQSGRPLSSGFRAVSMSGVPALPPPPIQVGGPCWSPQVACPTSRVLGSPLTSRQSTGISMLPVPVDGVPVRPSLGDDHLGLIFWANGSQEAFSGEVWAPGCTPRAVYHKPFHPATRTPSHTPPPHTAAAWLFKLKVTSSLWLAVPAHSKDWASVPLEAEALWAAPLGQLRPTHEPDHRQRNAAGGGLPQANQK